MNEQQLEGLSLNAILREKELCKEQIETAESLIGELRTRFDELEDRINLLNAVKEKLDNFYVKENLKAAVQQRNEVANKLAAQHSNADGYEEILVVLEQFEKTLN